MAWCQTQYALPCNVKSQTWMIRFTRGMSLKYTCLVHPQESQVGPEHLNSQQIPHVSMESENHSSRAPLAWTVWEVFSLRDLAKSDSPLSGEAELPVAGSWVWATCRGLIRLTSSVLSLSNKSDVLDRGQEPLENKFCSPILLPPLQLCMCAKSLQLCPILCDPVDCSPPGSSVPGIHQARILEWVAMPSSRGLSWPRDEIQVLLCHLHWQAGSLRPGKPLQL